VTKDRRVRREERRDLGVLTRFRQATENELGRNVLQDGRATVRHPFRVAKREASAVSEFPSARAGPRRTW